MRLRMLGVDECKLTPSYLTLGWQGARLPLARLVGWTAIMQSSLTRMHSLRLTCVVIYVCITLAGSQAPGDGHQTCLDKASHPVYDRHVRPLMDTRDYIQLLPYSDGTGGVWKTLDEDGGETTRTVSLFGALCSCSSPTFHAAYKSFMNNIILLCMCILYIGVERERCIL